MQNNLIKLLSGLLVIGLLSFGCAKTHDTQSTVETSAPAKQQVTENAYEGKIVGKSNKAKTISIEIGKGNQAKVMMVKFDDQTTGVQNAVKGHAAIIKFEKRDGGIFATAVKPKLAKLPPGVTEIKTEELEQLVADHHEMLIIDSRPASRYGQSHLPGAVSIPVPMLKERKDSLLPKDKNMLLVFYCGGPTCGMSTASAGLAKKLGYTNIRVYLDGEPAWSEAGLPTYATYNFIKNGNVVLVDVRDSQEAVKGRIKGAYSIPYEDLEDRLDDIPRNAPVILYGNEEALDAVEDMRDDGFKFVSLVKGGLTGWIASGEAVEKGPIFNTEISWVRKLGKGEVSLEDFKKAASGEDKDAVIVDARTDAEVAELGIFKNTINIPLDEIPARMNELPKDKKIYVHCATGARADMAYKELVKNGYNAKFLLLNIADAACDCEIIRP